MTYVNEHSVLALGILFLILPPLAVTGRFLVGRRKPRLDVDDWLCLPALVCQPC